MNKKKPAVLVDSDLYAYSSFIQGWVQAKQDYADLILLVTNPHDTDRLQDNDIEWTAVIQNTGDLSDLEFKTAALNAVKNLSNMIPAIGLDDDIAVQLMYEANGVLITSV